MAARLTAYIVVAIVAVTLIAGLIVGAQREDYSGPVDLIIYNGTVYPADEDGGFAEALAIRGNQILRVGSNREIKRLARRQTRLVDAHGGAVLPGFNDSHLHFLRGSLSLAARHASSQEMRARGDAHNGLEQVALHETPVDERGEQAVPTVVSEDAPDPVGRVLPQVDRAGRLRAIRSGIREAHALGITSVHDAGGSVDELGLIDEIRRDGELRLRMYPVLSVGPNFTEQDAERLDEIRQQYPDDPLLKVGAVELVLNDTGQTDRDPLKQPHIREATGPQDTFTPENLTRVVTMLDRRGWQILIHTSGDTGVRMALDAFEAAAATNPAPPGGRRHRIEHIESIDPADIPRLGASDLLAGIRPFQENRGMAADSSGSTYHALREAGIRLVVGSDWPAAWPDPWLGVHGAVTGDDRSGLLEEISVPEETLPLTAAIDAYTRDAAYASFDEQRKGMLVPGMLADVVIFSTDIFRLAPDRLLDARVEVTIFDGQIVSSREPPLTEP